MRSRVENLLQCLFVRYIVCVRVYMLVRTGARPEVLWQLECFIVLPKHVSLRCESVTVYLAACCLLLPNQLTLAFVLSV